ncbi:MAG: ankyrin repeat domain-containing protein, partial [Planctomycetia bacterium]|nr:ankyrin repeat domain-containing protein [Planctomycetia bacterium]
EGTEMDVMTTITDEMFRESVPETTLEYRYGYMWEYAPPESPEPEVSVVMESVSPPESETPPSPTIPEEPASPRVGRLPYQWDLPIPNAWTPLHLAAAAGDVRAIRKLLESGASPDAPDTKGWTPLHLAVQKESPDAVRTLLEAGADLFARTADGLTPIDLAEQKKAVKTVRLLHQWIEDHLPRPESDFASDPESEPPVESAVVRISEPGPGTAEKSDETELPDEPGEPEVREVDVPIPEKTIAGEIGESASEVPTEGKRNVEGTTEESTELPLEEGAGATGVVESGVETLSEPSVVALTEADVPVPEVERDAGMSALHYAVQIGNRDWVRGLLAGGMNPDLREGRIGETPLHLASRHGRVELVTELLRFGASVNSQNREGATPLLLAAQEGHTEVVRLLLDAGAVPDIPANGRVTPLHQAAALGHEEIATLLLERQASSAPTMEGGWTPLHLAVQEGHDSLVALLLRSGAAPQSETVDGVTPLHLAAACGHVEILRRLLRCADPDYQTRRYGTSLHQAVFHDQPECVSVLLEAGATRTLRTDDGRTVYDLAHSERVLRRMENRP